MKHLKANVSEESHIGSDEVKDFIERFKWDDMKFPRSRALADIATQINDKMM